MNRIKIKKSIAEARKFLLIANLVLKEEEKYAFIYKAGSKETGALRRSSMDLTRSLAELRK